MKDTDADRESSDAAISQRMPGATSSPRSEKGFSQRTF